MISDISLENRKSNFLTETIITSTSTGFEDDECIQLPINNINRFEHELSVFDSFLLYKKAVFWCIVVSLTIVMDGYDGALVSGFYAQPAFQKYYGELLHDGTYSISAAWQTALGMGSPVGRVIGGLGVGYFASKFGRKYTLIGALIMIIGILFIVFFATSIGMLCAGLILSGILWGVFNTLAPTYASEVCPLQLRGILTAYINLAWVIGQFINMGVMNGFVNVKSQWAYRIPFGIQWIWPVMILCVLPFAPESPWWLVRKDRVSDARQSLKRLTSFNNTDQLEKYLNTIVKTDKEARKIDNSITWSDCFRETDLRRTEIACMVWSCQALCGNPMFGYVAYFFEMAGISETNAFKIALGLTAVGFIGNIISWFLTFRFGRRANYLGGLILMALVMFFIGILDIPRKNNNSTKYAWGQSIFFFVFAFIYDLTIGPVAFIIVSEIPSVRLREKTIALATTAYSLWGVVFQIAVPYMLNPQKANWSGKTCFVFFVLGILTLVWTYFRLPETANRTYSEIDRLFKLNLPARKFKGYKFF
ncbi:uncharacterized protein SAPINGB_P000861 [Magnusiomyces paraingens]|uniref:Major facilitator superfamily (MFS) profile domain-containing protein n=1 Tax=Magnusiomyces paraingens TaxID=2606893 RepID=A0A5E8B8X9_9ASCO|nr:uncharacterized protein SAPINGB_P000861 [Saprochaete ingens]VVT45728.1 unnamed protein product [Saprochaete ingens]